MRSILFQEFSKIFWILRLRKIGINWKTFAVCHSQSQSNRFNNKKLGWSKTWKCWKNFFYNIYRPLPPLSQLIKGIYFLFFMFPRHEWKHIFIVYFNIVQTFFHAYFDITLNLIYMFSFYLSLTLIFYLLDPMRR